MFKSIRRNAKQLFSLRWLPRWLQMTIQIAAICALLCYIGLWLMVRSHANSVLENPPTRPADAALVLGARAYLHGAPNPCLVGRVEAGVDLASHGLVSTLVMSGGGDREDGRIESETMQQIAHDAGFRGRILLESKSRSTQENFSLSRPLLRENRIVSVIIVTEPYHLWRAQKLVQAGLFGRDFDVQFKAAPSQCWQTWGMFYKGSLREPLAIINNFAKGYFSSHDDN